LHVTKCFWGPCLTGHFPRDEHPLPPKIFIFPSNFSFSLFSLSLPPALCVCSTPAPLHFRFLLPKIAGMGVSSHFHILYGRSLNFVILGIVFDFLMNWSWVFCSGIFKCSLVLIYVDTFVLWWFFVIILLVYLVTNWLLNLFLLN
jgi:hypothetical protein